MGLTPAERETSGSPLTTFLKQAAVAAFLFILFLLIWYAIDLLLLIFASVLLAVFLQTLSQWVSTKTKLSHGLALAVVSILLMTLIIISAWFLAPQLTLQVNQLSRDIPQALRQLELWIAQFAWGESVIRQFPDSDDFISEKTDALAGLTGVFATTLGVVGSIAFVLFVGLYFAAQHELYTEGIVRLVPPSNRNRAREILGELGHTLRWWLLGQSVSMAILGVTTSAMLWLLGIPLALTLGLLTALLTFVPYLGPLIAAVPIVLLALLQGPTQAIYVLLAYTAIQTAEGYVLVPLILQRAVSLPPAMAIGAQVLMGMLSGALGFVVATPLSAALLVLIKEIYVRDILGDEMESSGNSSERSLGRQVAVDTPTN